MSGLTHTSEEESLDTTSQGSSAPVARMLLVFNLSSMLFYSLFFECFQCDIRLVHYTILSCCMLHPETVLIVPCLVSNKVEFRCLNWNQYTKRVDHVFNRGRILRNFIRNWILVDLLRPFWYIARQPWLFFCAISNKVNVDRDLTKFPLTNTIV